MASGEFRLRVRYRKDGRLRWLSHLETCRALERAVRRSRLPYAVTRGFSPHMKLAFGPALPVGTAGSAELLDLLLVSYVPAAEAVVRLRAASAEGLAIEETRYVEAGLPSLAASLTIAVYDVRVEGVVADRMKQALDRVRRDGRLTIEHKGKHKVYDLARSLPKEPRVEGIEDGVAIEVAVRMGPEGSLRPEALVEAALASTDADGAVMSVSRTDLLEEAEGAWRRP
ncbi:MAG: radical SAM protein [Coriobacteriaceae bacterium]|nr:radical SAM protein [Coriobacteriaceae bacterium]